MIQNDKQYGKPYVMFKLTKAQIEAIPDLEVGSFAMAEDVNEIGYLTDTGWEWVVIGSGGEGGATDFLSLTDTPVTYSGAGGKVVTVKNTEDGLEFAYANDPNAIHVNATNEIANKLTFIGTPSADDKFIVENTADGSMRYTDTDAMAIPLSQHFVGSGHDHIGGDGGQLTHGQLIGLESDGHSNVFHKSIGDEIHDITEKGAPVGDDIVLIEDSAASWAKKKSTLAHLSDSHYHSLDSLSDVAITAVASGQLLKYNGTEWANANQSVTDSDAIHDNVTGEINAITAKSSITLADLVLLEDSAASYAKKKMLLSVLLKGTYVALDTPLDLTDSAAHSWAPYAAPVGTYTFRPQDNSSAWPSDATALHVLILGRWAAASNSSILSLRKTSTGTNHIQLRAISATVGLNVNGNVSLDGSGYFYAVVEGADLAVGVIRLLGYYR